MGVLMTVSNSQSSVFYQGNDSSIQFSIPFSFIDETALRVFLIEPDGLSRIVDARRYHIDKTRNMLFYPAEGAPLASGWKLAILRYTDDIQPMNLTNQGAFYPEAVEGAFDRVVQEVQEVRRDVGRSLKIPLGTPDDDADHLAETLLDAARKAIDAAEKTVGIEEDVRAVKEAAIRVAIDASTAAIAGASARETVRIVTEASDKAVNAQDQADTSAAQARADATVVRAALVGVTELASFLKVLDYGEIADSFAGPETGTVFDFGELNYG